MRYKMGDSHREKLSQLRDRRDTAHVPASEHSLMRRAAVRALSRLVRNQLLVLVAVVAVVAVLLAFALEQT